MKKKCTNKYVQKMEGKPRWPRGERQDQVCFQMRFSSEILSQSGREKED